MELTIDTEKESEFAELYEFIRIAFQTAPHADGDEQDYVNRLRESDRYIPELALTIKDGHTIVGHIMLTKTTIARGESQSGALLLSPVCTLLEYRNRGIASALIRYSLQLAREKGYQAVFLVGNPNFYTRFGFMSITAFGIKQLGDIPEQYCMALELEAGYLGKKGGTISIS